MKKRFLCLMSALVAVFMAVIGLSACNKVGVTPNGTGGGQLASVDVSTITVTEQVGSFTVSWKRVSDADSYAVTMGGVTESSPITSINLRQAKFGFTMPANGRIELTIVAKGEGRADSKPTTFNYTAEGVQLESPKNTKIENGVLEWNSDSNAAEYNLTVNGAAVSVTEPKINLKGYSGKLDVSITAVGEGVYYKNSVATEVRVNSAHTALTLGPVTQYTLKDGVLSWPKVSDASGYMVVDLDRTVTVVTETEYYIEDVLGDHNLVYGVYPISAKNGIDDAEVEPVDIKYLEGNGTASSPYLIKTPFDLRAIDYYEAKYAEKIKAEPSAARNYYRIENDIDYDAVLPEDSEVSNIYTLSKPFYGTLDGNGKTLSNIYVKYDGGYWALFDMLVVGSTVKNLTFNNPTIYNNHNLQKPDLARKATIATVAYANYGTVDNITLKTAIYAASGGEVSGIVTHNYGTVKNCTLEDCMFMEKATGQISQACYEMAGVALENYGTVSDNNVVSLTLSGSQAVGDEGGKYNIARTVGGIVSVNRKGGKVTNNKYGAIDMLYMLDNYDSTKNGFEFGGLVAYNAGTVTVGASSNLGTFQWSPSDLNDKAKKNVTTKTGGGTDLRGKAVGKNDGTVN